MIRQLIASICIILLAAPAFAKDPIEGIWQGPPDSKGQIGHIEIKDCGGHLCGMLIRAFAPNGAPVTTPNVGKLVMWNMQAAGNGHYGEGRIYVPVHKRDYAAKLKLRGDTLEVKGCVGPVCQGQTWSRVK